MTAGGGEAGSLVSVPLSALEHVAYCERQAALIHLEATWTEAWTRSVATCSTMASTYHPRTGGATW